MSVLVGPADADAFRTKRGWQRFYLDPLPGCDIAPEDDEANVYPSISAVKKAGGGDWSFVTLKRLSKATPNTLRRMADMERSERHDAMKSLEKLGKQLDFNRGTIIHLYAEDLLAGRPIREIDMLAQASLDLHPQAIKIADLYRGALEDFFAAYQPEPIAVEHVVINRTKNGVGWGGTADARVRLGAGPHAGGVFDIDWKSRGLDSNHGAYDEEAAQISAVSDAEYAVVAGENGEAKRIKLPRPDGGLVVSIKPDGCRVYPVDIDEGLKVWDGLHERYVKNLTKYKPIKRVWPQRRAS